MAKKLVGVLQDSNKNLENLMNAVSYMQNNYVLVGIPQKTSSRPEDKIGSKEITNAELLYIHTNGSPVNNIPARPVIEPAIYNDSERLSKMLMKGFQQLCDGDVEKCDRTLQLIGTRAQKVCRDWFTNPANGWPPNSPGVIAAKLRKGSTAPKPLIDTGELRKSITYVIVKDGVRQE